MRLLSMIRLRFRSLLARATVEQELDEELQYHFDRDVDKYRTAGMSAEEARRQALREMGAITQRKEECRDMRGLNWLDNTLQDFRYAIRQLRKSLGFACTTAMVSSTFSECGVLLLNSIESICILASLTSDRSDL
jgi:hypothetical protein